MAKCDYCNTFILFGGVNQNGMRFCNNKCYQDGFLLSAAQQIPVHILDSQVDQVHQGMCPKCNGSGPVDVHTSYQVYSVLVMTRWVTQPKVCCRSCGIKSQAGNLFISLFFGWWGFPWGLILTPVQVTRNLMSMCSPPDPTRPSAQLEKLIKLNLAARLVAQHRANQ